MRSKGSRIKFLASAIPALALVPIIGIRLVSRAESKTSRNGVSTKADDTTQEKIARAMSAGPDNISKSAQIIDTDPQGNKVTLREGSNGFTCIPGNPNVVGDPPMVANAASMQLAVGIGLQCSQTKADKYGSWNDLHARRRHTAKRSRSV